MFKKISGKIWTIKIVPFPVRTVTVLRFSLAHLLTAIMFVIVLLIGIWFTFFQRSKQHLAREQELHRTLLKQKKEIEKLTVQKQEMKEILYETEKKFEKRKVILQQKNNLLRHLMAGEQPDKILAMQQYSKKTSRSGEAQLKEIRRKLWQLHRESQLEEHKFKAVLEHIPSRWPVNGYIVSSFGDRSHPVTGRFHFHKGVDIRADYSSAIHASATGIVFRAGWEDGYGNFVEIDHDNGFVSKYAHCSQLLVKTGDAIKKGQVIALVGETGLTTGPHLHYEIHRNGATIDPSPYLDFTSRFVAITQVMGQ